MKIKFFVGLSLIIFIIMIVFIYIFGFVFTNSIFNKNYNSDQIIATKEDLLSYANISNKITSNNSIIIPNATNSNQNATMTKNNASNNSENTSQSKVNTNNINSNTRQSIIPIANTVNTRRRTRAS